MRQLLRRLWHAIRQCRHEADLAEELESHRAMTQRALEADGLQTAKAATQARRQLGNLALAREDARAVWIWPWLESVWQDARIAVRSLRRQPGFAIVAILTLALGIATNTAMFSVVNTVLLKPFAYTDPERIVMFQNIYQQGGLGGTASPTEFDVWRRQTVAFQDISAYAFTVANFTDEAFPEQVQAMRVTANFFRLCGADALHGRTFTAEDDVPNMPKSVVLAYAFWQRRFAGNPEVIGRRMTLSGERYEIVGVVGSNLKNGQISETMLGNGDIIIDEPPDVYIPFQLDPNSAEHGHYFNVAGRLKPGITLAAANARLQASYAEYARTWPDDLRVRTGFRVQPLQEAIVGRVRNSLLLLLGAVSFVLLIACANVANLLLARASGRTREMAIRAAVGAGRGRIVRQLLTESVMLSLAGGVLGVAAGYAGIRAMLSLSPDNIPRIGTSGSNVSLDWRVLGFTLALSIVTSILFGLVPAMHSSRADVSSMLKESGNRSGTGVRHHKTLVLLVTTEMALALVLLIGAALLMRTFIAIRHVNPGFDVHHVLTMRMSLTGPQFENPASVTRVIQEGLRRIRALRGVEVAAASCCVPLENVFGGGFQIAGRPDGPASQGVAVSTPVSAGYFETFKIPILRGRTFTERDESGPPVVVINQTLAQQFWPNSDPLNDYIISGQSSRKIIGIVGDVHVRLNRDPLPTIYGPSAAGSGLFQMVPLAWVIRTRGAPMSLSAAIQHELREASGGLPVARVRTMEDILSRSTAAESFNALVLMMFGCSALLLAAVGIYGLMAYSVRQRTHEIGIRRALGADEQSVRNLILAQGLKLSTVGLAVGVAMAFGVSRVLASMLFGVTTTDPLVFVAAPIMLASVALLAAWIPAHRATKVDPLVALRCD